MTRVVTNRTDSPVICLDIGGSFIKLGVSKTPGEAKFLGKVAIQAADWQAIVTDISTLIDQHQQQFDSRSVVAISTTGLVDPKKDQIFAGNIPAFTGHLITRELSAALGKPVVIANDANCFTLAEAKNGAAQGVSVVFGAILGTGVGGGLVINGDIIPGRRGLAGEWGHAPILANEWHLDGCSYHLPRITCGCGQQGCVETYGSARGMEQIHRHLHQQHLTSKDIVKQWQLNDSAATLSIGLWLQVVSEPLALVVNTLGVDRVVVGGGLANDRELIKALDTALKTKILQPPLQPLVVPGKYSQEGGLIGASMLV